MHGVGAGAALVSSNKTFALRIQTLDHIHKNTHERHAKFFWKGPRSSINSSPIQQIRYDD
jgi:hypothetical protein